MLPWEYGVRNLFRRPWRTALTLAALSTVILLVLVVVGFIRGLEQSLAASGDERVVLVFTLGTSEALEYSALPPATAEVLGANLAGVKRRFGQAYLSPEIYLATRASASPGDAPKGAAPPPGTMGTGTGLVRGVTPAALWVRRSVEIVEGRWPEAGEVLVGRLAAAQLGAADEEVAVGRTLEFEGRRWRVSGRFTAVGAIFESEIWCRLEDLQRAQQRQDLSLVALQLGPGAQFSEVDMFTKQRLDLELEALRETDYYAALAEHYRPVRALGWAMAGLVAGAGVFAALNTMFAAAMGRIRELAALQTLGFLRRAIALSLVQESTLLAAAATLVAAAVGVAVIDGAAVRFTMGSFPLRIDGATLLWGCGTGLVLGIVGAVPPAVRALRRPIVAALRAV